MERPIFQNFRIPAYELPNKCPSNFPIKLSNFGTPMVKTNLKTNPLEIKQLLTNAKKSYNFSETSCQADLQEDFTQQLEKEVLTEPTMQFLEVSDINPSSNMPQISNGHYKIPTSTQDFIQIENISIKPPLPTQKFNVDNSEKEKKIEISKEEALKMEAEARNPIAEFVQTQDYFLKAAHDRIKQLEDDAQRLEDDMKLQNEDLDRINVDYAKEFHGKRNEFAIKICENFENEDKNYQDYDEEEIRIEKIIGNNKELYQRIQRVLTPKVESFMNEEPVKETSLMIESKGNKKITPIIAKRLSNAMNSAAGVINASKNIYPSIMKKPKK